MSFLVAPSITSPSSFTNTLYTFNNVTIGATGSTGSGTLDVSHYTTKSVYGYIGTTQNASGSLVVSGSFDGANYFQLKSGSFNSGSLSYFTFFEAVPLMQVFLYNSSASVISGSLSATAY